MANKFKNHVVETKTVTLSATAQAQSEVPIPAYGDIKGFIIEASVTATGTLTTPAKLSACFTNVSVKSKSGDLILQNIRGSDLYKLERLRGIGNLKTIADVSTSAGTVRWVIPLNIEKRDQEARFSVTVCPYSDLAASGATGGSVTYTITAMYYDETVQTKTEKITRITKSLLSGVNTAGIDLPKSVQINRLFFAMTETKLSSIRFTADGVKELDGLTVGHMTALEDYSLTGKHVTGEFVLPAEPFYCTSATAFDINTSDTDTIEMYVVSTLD